MKISAGLILGFCCALGISACSSGPSQQANRSNGTSSTIQSGSGTASSSSTSSSNTPSGASGAELKTCSGSELTVAEDESRSVVGAGTTELAVVITNHSQASCHLQGYPVVAISSATSTATKTGSGQFQLKVTAAGPAPVSVVVAPGASAGFFIAVSNVAVDGVGCTTVKSEEVILPGTKVMLPLAAGMSACGPGIEVYAVVPIASLTG